MEKPRGIYYKPNISNIGGMLRSTRETSFILQVDSRFAISAERNDLDKSGAAPKLIDKSVSDPPASAENKRITAERK
jgi:hypothetical protein